MPLPKLTRRAWIRSGLAALFTVQYTAPAFAATYRKIPIQYIAALAPEGAKSGTGAETWGIWRRDPGPIGVWLKYYKALLKVGAIGPTGWRFDIDDWWLDENGLIMKAPDFPITPGQYYVTNGEQHISLLTIDSPDENGAQTWSLSDDKTIANVTHGPCRSARYTPEGATQTCTPENADQSAFPLKPGESPPDVSACHKKEYAVLIVFGVPA